MNDIDYKYFRHLVNTGSTIDDSHNYAQMIAKIDRLYDQDDILYCYPRNVFNENERKELVLFTQRGIVCVTRDPEGNILVKSLLEKIESVDLFFRRTTNSVQLTIKFENRTTFQLDSLNDTNEHRNTEYMLLIEDIYKHLNKEF